MKRLNQADLSELKLKNSTKVSRAEHVYKEVDMLSSGESLMVEKREWPLKAVPAPTNLPGRLRSMGRKFQVRHLEDESAFVITRTD